MKESIEKVAFMIFLKFIGIIRVLLYIYIRLLCYLLLLLISFG